MTRKLIHFGLIVSLLLSCASCASFRPPQQPVMASARMYLSAVHERIAAARQDMFLFQTAGHAAARRVVDGGLIFVAGSQPDFIAEAVGRAGGLMGIKPLGNSKIYPHDVVLYAARGPLTEADLTEIARCKEAGAYVLAFAAANGSARPPTGPDLLIDSGPVAGLPTGHGICPLDTVTNLINLWVFTGEFASACTQLGKMPVFYESYGLPNGRERDAKYTGQLLHGDDLTVATVQPGVLGRAYLDRIDLSLRSIEHEQMDELTHAGHWVHGAGPGDCSGLFFCHIYPGHFHDSRAPQPIGATVGQEVAQPPLKAMVLHLSYQQPPQNLIDQARLRHFHLFYCSVLRGSGGMSENVIYLKPHWPLEDACVKVPGYDVPILPASGVVQATIYWSIVAEAYGSP